MAPIKINILLLFLLFSQAVTAQHQKTTNNKQNTQSLLIKLDENLAKVREYDQAYESNIATIKAKLRYSKDKSGSLSLYKTHEEISQYYESYQSDSAMHYLQKNIILAKEMHWPAELAKTQLSLSHVLNTIGLLNESVELLNRVDRTMLTANSLSLYYSAYREYFIYCQENSLGTVYADKYLEMANLYADSAMQYMDENSPSAFNIQLLKRI